MKIHLYEVKLTMTDGAHGIDAERIERKFVAIGVSEVDAMDRVKQYYINHPTWNGSILRAEAVKHEVEDFVFLNGEVL